MNQASRKSMYEVKGIMKDNFTFSVLKTTDKESAEKEYNKLNDDKNYRFVFMSTSTPCMKGGSIEPDLV